MAALFSVQGTIQWTSFCHPVNDSDLFFLEVRPFNFSNHRWIMKSERKWTAVLLNRRVRTSKPTVCLTVAFAAPITRSSLSYKCFCRETCCCPDLQFCSKEWAEKEYIGFTESAQHQRSSTCTAQLCATVNPTSSLIVSGFFLAVQQQAQADWLPLQCLELSIAPPTYSHCPSPKCPNYPYRAFCLSDLWLFSWQMVQLDYFASYLHDDI